MINNFLAGIIKIALSIPPQNGGREDPQLGVQLSKRRRKSKFFRGGQKRKVMVTREQDGSKPEPCSPPGQSRDPDLFFLKYALASALGATGLAIALILVATELWPPFTWLDDTLSNLGNPEHPESAPVFNAAYLIASTGVLPFFSYHLREGIRDEPWGAKLGAACLPVAAGAVALLAIFTDYSPTLHVHRACSLTFFVALACALLFTATSWLRDPMTRPYALVFLVALAGVGAAWGIDAAPWAPWQNQAIPEFVSVLLYASVVLALGHRAWVTRDAPR